MAITRILLFAILLIIPVCYSQNISGEFSKYTVSNPYPVFNGWKYYFSHDEDVHTLKFSPKTCLHQWFDGKDASLKSAEEISGFMVKNVIYTKEETTEGNYLFYLNPNDDKKSFNTCVRKLDFSAENPILEETVIQKVNHPVPYGYAINLMAKPGEVGPGDISQYTVKGSDDKTKTLISYRIVPKARNTSKFKDTFDISVFDENWGILWSRRIEMPYVKNQMKVLENYVDSHGNAYILIKYFPNTVSKEDEYFIQLMRIDDEQYTVATIVPEDGQSKYNVNLGYTDRKDGSMMVSMFYSFGEKKRKLGLMTMEIGNSGDFDKQKIIEIPTELIEMAIGETTIKESDTYAVKFASSHTDKEGNVTIIGGFNSIDEHGYSWTYHSFFVLQVDKNGKLNWIKSLEMSSGDFEMNFGMNIGSSNKDKLYTFDENSLEIICSSYIPRKAGENYNSYITGYKIDLKNGNAEKTHFFKSDEVNGIPIYQFSFDRIKRVGDGVYVMEAYKKDKEDIMVRFEIPN